MLLTFLEKIFGLNLRSHQSSDCASDASTDDIPRYPPFDRGLPAVNLESILNSQREIIDRIERTAGLTPEEYRDKILPVIQNLARYVHLLPATNSGHHRGAGGLFRMALEIGLYSLQAANSSVFANRGTLTTEARYKLHPKWVYATFVAGMCSEIYRPITNMVVVDDIGETWPQLLIPLLDWIDGKNKNRYFIVWNIQDELGAIGMSQASTAYLMNAIVPMASLQYMNDGSSEIVAAMTACVTGAIPKGSSNQIREIVVGVRNKVIERDIRSNSERYGACVVGSHLEPHLIDAMRRLIKKKSWVVNGKAARIWYSSEGLFVIWKPAATEIIALLTEERQPGIPQDGDTLADILLASGIAESNDDDGRYWEICIPGTMQLLPALKISKVEILFPEDPSSVEKTTERLVASAMQKHDAEKEFAEKIAAVNVGSALARDVPEKAVVALKPKTVEASQPIPALMAPVQVAAVPTTQAVEKEKPVLTAPVQSVDSHHAASIVTEPEPEPIQPVVKSSQQTKLSVPVTARPASLTPVIGTVTTKVAEPTVQSKPKSGQVTDLGAQAEKIYQSLPGEMADVLRAILDDYKEDCLKGEIFAVEGGMAVSTQELESHGNINYAAMIKVLADKNWLWTDPVKPMRKIFQLDHKSKKHSVIVFRSDISRGIGFDWKKPKVN